MRSLDSHRDIVIELGINSGVTLHNESAYIKYSTEKDPNVLPLKTIILLNEWSIFACL